MHFKISYQKNQGEIPSASGIVKGHDFYYAIGDDSPYLFQLNSEFEISAKYPIYFPTDDLETARIPKKDKPDFEALEMVSENEIISFGSGSKSPERDDLIRIRIGDTISVHTYKLTAFYDRLKNMEIMKGSELNIEAAAYSNNVLYLFNRRKNIIFSLHYKDLIRFLEKDSPLPEVKFYECALPKINGIEAGFSGATVCQQNSALLVTASVEDTGNAYDDGEILGSLIGVVPIENTEIKQPINWIPIPNPDKPFKVESITIDKEIDNRNVAVVLTTDNDDGQSQFLKGVLQW